MSCFDYPNDDGDFVQRPGGYLQAYTFFDPRITDCLVSCCQNGCRTSADIDRACLEVKSVTLHICCNIIRDTITLKILSGSISGFLRWPPTAKSSWCAKTDHSLGGLAMFPIQNHATSSDGIPVFYEVQGNGQLSLIFFTDGAVIEAFSGVALPAED